MVTVRRSAERGGFDGIPLAGGRLDTKHSFSFGHYHDPRWMGFRSLRVINEDRVSPGGGFPTHMHRDMEIVSYVLEGALEHRDSLGTGSVIRPGDVQRMTAGSGVEHSEFNALKDRPVHFLQIWIVPERRNIEPSYEQRHFSVEDRKNRLRLIASRDGAEGSVTVHQDVRMYAGVLEKGREVALRLADGRHGWVQVARGSVTVGGVALAQGDAAILTEELSATIAATDDAEVVAFDLA